MATLTLELPSGLSAEEARCLIAIKLWEERRLSLGEAAEMAGLSTSTLKRDLEMAEQWLFDELMQPPPGA